MTGLVHPQRFWRNGGARLGDVLLLSKPLGSGPIATSIKRDKADPAVVQKAMVVMATLNRAACEAMQGIEVHGATDVTGFGFVGHSLEMADGAGLDLAVDAAALPLLDGALQVVRDGVMSGGCRRGKEHYGPRVQLAPTVDPALASLVFDAETSGGLLLAVAERDADRAQARLRDAGAPASALVGRFVARTEGPTLTLR